MSVLGSPEGFCLSSMRFSLTYSADLQDTIDSGNLHHDQGDDGDAI